MIGIIPKELYLLPTFAYPTMIILINIRWVSINCCDFTTINKYFIDLDHFILILFMIKFYEPIGINICLTIALYMQSN